MIDSFCGYQYSWSLWDGIYLLLNSKYKYFFVGSIFCLNNHYSNLIFSDCFGNQTHKEVVFTIHKDREYRYTQKLSSHQFVKFKKMFRESFSWTFTEHWLNVYWTFSERSLNVQSGHSHWMFSEGSVKVHWTSTERSLNVVSERSLNMYFSSSSNVQWRFTERSANVHWTFTERCLWTFSERVFLGAKWSFWTFTERSETTFSQRSVNVRGYQGRHYY